MAYFSPLEIFAILESIVSDWKQPYILLFFFRPLGRQIYVSSGFLGRAEDAREGGVETGWEHGSPHGPPRHSQAAIPNCTQGDFFFFCRVTMISRVAVVGLHFCLDLFRFGAHARCMACIRLGLLVLRLRERTTGILQ